MNAPASIIRLYLVQRGLCFYCMEPMLMSSRIPGKTGHKGWTREHIVPRSKGGKDGYANLVLAHLNCNARRGNADPTPEILARAKEIHDRASRIGTKAAKYIVVDPDLRARWIGR
jgi:5-methylcytosine-specific restriction endonuclease McrA